MYKLELEPKPNANRPAKGFNIIVNQLTSNIEQILDYIIAILAMSVILYAKLDTYQAIVLLINYSLRSPTYSIRWHYLTPVHKVVTQQGRSTISSSTMCIYTGTIVLGLGLEYRGNSQYKKLYSDSSYPYRNYQSQNKGTIRYSIEAYKCRDKAKELQHSNGPIRVFTSPNNRGSSLCLRYSQQSPGSRISSRPAAIQLLPAQLQVR